MNNEQKHVQPQIVVCSLSWEIYHALHLKRKKIYTIQIGHHSHDVYFIPIEREESCMLMPEHIAKKLCINQSTTINMWRVAQQIYLGPVIGVFVHPKYIRGIQTNRVPESIRQHFLANKAAHCMLYYFSLKDINWQNKRIKGCYYDEVSKKWRYTWLPLPNIFYDRGIGLKKKELVQAEQIRKQFSTFGNISFINKGILKKWELYSSLSKHPHLQHYLPQTILFTSHADVFKMLQIHGFIFIKSSDGYGAREVISIKFEQNNYIITLRKKGLFKLKIREKSTLKKLLSKLLESKVYIIQQGIKAIQFQKLHMDLRILIQKNNQGLWQVTYNRARIAELTNPIINSSLAKQIISYSSFVETSKHVFPTKMLPSEHALNELSLTFAHNIEREFGCYGELGLDLIIDQKGKIWFIEANSKPTKKINKKLDLDIGITNQFLSVLEYAKYLQKVKQSAQVKITY